MPTSGLSLVGFMADRDQAIFHLRNTCFPLPATKPDADLEAEWQGAKAKLGTAIPNAGHPALTQIPPNDLYIQALLASPWGPHLNSYLSQGATFQMVELMPLLAFQFTVDLDRSLQHCGAMSNPPSQRELLEVCLPTGVPRDDWSMSHSPGSAMIRSRSLNLAIVAAGPLPVPKAANLVGIQFAWLLPVLHVVRYNGRCYLFNGYHRAVGAAQAGAVTAPCLFRDVKTEAEAAIAPPATFPLSLLESSDPPTVGHYVQGRAWDVQLRRVSRIIQVNWSQHQLFEE